jgi:VanZ family protein
LIRRLRATLPWAFWACALAILVLALLPPAVPMPSTGWDKANHALAFGTLGVLGCLAWPQRRWQVLAGLVGYGVLIELLQALTPYRDADARDVLADTAGLLIAEVLLRLEARLSRRGQGGSPSGGG